MSIQVGIIGFGYMGHFHMRKVRSFPEDAALVAVYDIKEEALADAREEGLKACTSVEEFLALPLDLVVVSTPMVASGYWVLSLFLWACLLMVSLKKCQKKSV